MAPHWQGPTEHNGLHTPRAELHVALVAPDRETADLWRRLARVVTPPFWKGGKVRLYVIHAEKAKDIDTTVALAMVDLGILDSADVGLVGYPSGLEAHDEEPA
jgi:hypothetical protein